KQQHAGEIGQRVVVQARGQRRPKPCEENDVTLDHTRDEEPARGDPAEGMRDENNRHQMTAPGQARTITPFTCVSSALAVSGSSRLKAARSRGVVAMGDFAGP